MNWAPVRSWKPAMKRACYPVILITLTLMAVLAPAVAQQPPPTPTPVVPCVGDCNGDGTVTTVEVGICQDIESLIQSLSVCLACDANGDGSVSPDEVDLAQQNSLNGCPLPPTPVPPPNDDFGDATEITTLPFSDTVDTTGATREPEEPVAPCDFGPLSGTVWYAFTPPESESISASANGSFFSAMVAVYTGNSLASLTELGCQPFGGLLTLDASVGTTYYFQVAGLFGQGGPLQFQLTVPPPPVASFGFFPSDPSIFDTIQFFDTSFDPVGAGFQSFTWDFGDGATATGSFTTHQYAADGDYTVQHGVTTVDGRTASTSQIVHVQTHDVAITKFSTPNAAKAGQTRSISVGLSSKRSPETVEVDLFKSTQGGLVQVGFLTQSVPVRPSNRTTDFDFSYTFTSADATIGKVTFRAVATIMGARDALPADNEAISLPVKVNH